MNIMRKLKLSYSFKLEKFFCIKKLLSETKNCSFLNINIPSNQNNMLLLRRCLQILLLLLSKFKQIN